MERTYEGFLKFNKKKPTEIKEATEDDIRQCFVDLEDLGFEIIINKRNNEYTPNYLRNFKFERYVISIRKENLFDIEDISEILKFAIPYLKDSYSLNITEINRDCHLYTKNGQIAYISYKNLKDFLSNITTTKVPNPVKTSKTKNVNIILEYI